jgi:DNA mismatch repair protein MSH4
VPKNVTPKTARVGIDTLIFLKESLKLSPRVVDVITSMKKVASNTDDDVINPLLAAIAQNLRDPELSKIEALIMGMITESTSYQKSAHAMRHQECFALKNGIHGLLDVARKTFLQTVEDIYAVRNALLYI